MTIVHLVLRVALQYTGLVALSATEILISYDMLATTCPPSLPPGDCDSIISIKLDVGLQQQPSGGVPAFPPTPDSDGY